VYQQIWLQMLNVSKLLAQQPRKVQLVPVQNFSNLRGHSRIRGNKLHKNQEIVVD